MIECVANRASESKAESRHCKAGSIVVSTIVQKKLSVLLHAIVYGDVLDLPSLRIGAFDRKGPRLAVFGHNTARFSDHLPIFLGDALDGVRVYALQ
jgi:hypothetical protein